MIVIVLGMHRSGTSALAGLLHHNGIDMGTGHFHPGPLPQNPKGFYEDGRFRKLNDRILAEHGYDVTSFDPNNVPYVSFSSSISNVRKLLETRCSEHSSWGWKDPRTCLTGRLWYHQLLDLNMHWSVRIIGIYRPVEDIRSSMLKRGNMEIHDEDFRKLAAKYVNGAELLHPDLWISFKDLMYNTNKVVDALAKINVSITDTSFIDPTLADRNKHA